MRDGVRASYRALTERLIERGLTVTTMESCTGGQIASLLTDTEGSSQILKGAFVTYSNEAKIRQGVPEEIIGTYGVYSAETAAAMAKACRAAYSADLGVGVTGSFGNADPGNADSVPGEVHVAIASEKGTETFLLHVPKVSSRLDGKLYVAEAVADALLQWTDLEIGGRTRPNTPGSGGTGWPKR